ncbi:hypothetical protein GGR51DRAFT_563826 [Nemania sp. FL0031]|nr:hypothetical protein GGR51DRAFT_563826 [Nemania sp. FL0031]
MSFVKVTRAYAQEELESMPKGITQSVWLPRGIMTDEEVLEGQRSLELSYKSKEDIPGYTVNSNDIVLNPGIWGTADYRARLAIHKRALKSPIRENTTHNSIDCNMSGDVLPHFEDSALSFPVWGTPASMFTNITVPDSQGSFCPVTPVPAAYYYEQQNQGMPSPVYFMEDSPVIDMSMAIIPSTHPEGKNRNARPIVGPGSNYLGNPSLALNKPAPVEDSQNVRFWVTGLPPDTTASEFLGAIRGVGSVFAINMVKPQLPEDDNDKRRRVRTAAASITFFSVDAGKAFMKKTLQFGTYTAQIVPNRISTAPMPRDGRSRVLLIEGHADLVNPESLERLADDWMISYITDSINYTSIGEKRNRVFWAFGSFRAQAHAVYLRIRKELAGKVYVRYGTDPCAAFEKRTPAHKWLSKKLMNTRA